MYKGFNFLPFLWAGSTYPWISMRARLFSKVGPGISFYLPGLFGQCDCVLSCCVLPSGCPLPSGRSHSLLGSPRVVLLGTSLAYGHRLIRMGQILSMCLSSHLSRILPSAASLPSCIAVVNFNCTPS